MFYHEIFSWGDAPDPLLTFQTVFRQVTLNFLMKVFKVCKCTTNLWLKCLVLLLNALVMPGIRILHSH